MGGGPDVVTGSGGGASTEIHVATGAAPADADADADAEGMPLAGSIFVSAGTVSVAADGTDAPAGAPTHRPGRRH